MPRSPEDPVIRDSNETLWAVFREGLYKSNEVSASGRWHPSRSPSREHTPWQSIQETTPFGRQEAPWRRSRTTLSILPPVSPNSPSPPRRTPLGEVTNTQITVLKHEVAKEDGKRAAIEAALRKIRDGMRDLELAQKM